MRKWKSDTAVGSSDDEMPLTYAPSNFRLLSNHGAHIFSCHKCGAWSSTSSGTIPEQAPELAPERRLVTFKAFYCQALELAL